MNKQKKYKNSLLIAKYWKKTGQPTLKMLTRQAFNLNELAFNTILKEIKKYNEEVKK